MTTTAPFAIRSPARARNRRTTRAALAAMFWVAAACLVAVSQFEIGRWSPAGATVASVASIVIMAWRYTRLCAPAAGGSHALGVGVAWLVLAILAEIAVSLRLAHGWYGLLGSPAHPLLRNLLLFVWVFAPALFAREGEDENLS